jgi:hypothetical protein
VSKYIKFSRHKQLTAMGLNRKVVEEYIKGRQKRLDAMTGAIRALRGSGVSLTDRVVLAARQEASSCRVGIKSSLSQLAPTYETHTTLTYQRRGIRVSVSLEAYPSKLVALEALRDKVRDVRTQAKAVYVDNKRAWLGGNYVAYQATPGPNGGYVFNKPGCIVNILKERKAKEVFAPKQPKTNEHHVGIELEFGSHADSKEIGIQLMDAGLSEFVTLKIDGSVRARNGDHAHEINILAPQPRISEIISKVTRILNGTNVKAYVNDSCGFHVHLDMRHRDRDRAFNNLVACQRILYRMVPVSRLRNQYCRMRPGRDLGRSRRSRRRSRYVGINAQALHSHGTLEVRIHSGTTDFAKVNNWVVLLATIADANRIGTVRSVNGMAAAAGLSDELKEYVKTRVDKFASQHGNEAAAVPTRASDVLETNEEAAA